MGKGRCGPALVSAKRLALPAALAALLATASAHAELKFTPTGMLTETYTDNVGLTNEELAKSELITELTPGFILADDSSRFNINAAYQYHYFDYSDRNVTGINQSESTLQSTLKAALVPELFFLDANASISQQAVSAFGPQVSDNPYSSVNRSEFRTYSLSPYVMDRIGSEATAQVRYTYSSVSTGANVLGNSQGNGVILDLASGPAFQVFTWDLQYNHQAIENAVNPAITSQTTTATAGYHFNPAFALTSNVGYDQYDYQALAGQQSKGNFWLLGFQWTPSPRTSLQASAGRRYFGSTYDLMLKLHSRHSVWSVSYSDAVTTTTGQAAMPGAINTSGLLTQLDSSGTGDQAQLQQTVSNFIGTTGVPPTLASNLNYYSYSFFRQRSWQGAAAFSTARSTLLLTLIDTEQTSLSPEQADSLLTGATGLFLNQNDRQISANAMWNWQLSSNGSLYLNLTDTRVTSLSTDLTSVSRIARLGVSKQLKPKLRGVLELRRTEGAAGNNFLSDYRENAVMASLTLQL